MNKIGKDVYIWTVNDEALLTKFIANRFVAAIITDRSELAMKILANTQDGLTRRGSRYIVQ